KLIENGAASTVSDRSAAVEVSFGKLILACWCEDWSRSWRVLSCEHARAGLRLTCTKQMGLTSCRIDLTRSNRHPDEDSRAELPGLLRRLIQSSLPGAAMIGASRSKRYARESTGAHLRFALKTQSETIACIAVSEVESQDAIDATLGAGLVWRDALGRRSNAVKRLMLFVPS